jgi:hypothetical protein
MHKEKLYNLYSEPSIIRMVKSMRIRWERCVAQMWEKRNVYRLSVGKPEGKRPLGNPRRRWVDNINMDHREREWDGMDCTDLAQERNQWRTLSTW